jgi:hypothetical protein
MRWNLFKRQHGAHHPVAARSPWKRPYVMLCLEQLESRIVPVTITRTSAPIFYNDFGVSPALTSAYASYVLPT